jgi:hypothetical protein
MYCHLSGYPWQIITGLRLQTKLLYWISTPGGTTIIIKLGKCEQWTHSNVPCNYATRRLLLVLLLLLSCSLIWSSPWSDLISLLLWSHLYLYRATSICLKISIFWDITPYSPLEISRYIGGTCRFYLQGCTVRKTRNQQEADSKKVLLPASMLISCMSYSWVMRMETTYSFETTIDSLNYMVSCYRRRFRILILLLKFWRVYPATDLKELHFTGLDLPLHTDLLWNFHSCNATTL